MGKYFILMARQAKKKTNLAPKREKCWEVLDIWILDALLFFKIQHLLGVDHHPNMTYTMLHVKLVKHFHSLLILNKLSNTHRFLHPSVFYKRFLYLQCYLLFTNILWIICADKFQSMGCSLWLLAICGARWVAKVTQWYFYPLMVWLKQ